jgi:hypothetical protein
MRAGLPGQHKSRNGLFAGLSRRHQKKLIPVHGHKADMLEQKDLSPLSV